MSIQIGDIIPEITMKRLGEDGMEDVNIADYVSDKKVVIFGVPGAFTPACAQKHLPGYVMKADQIKEEGIDEIICVAVNDPFVMKHWGEVSNATGKVTMMPDWDAKFVEAIGLTMDGTGAGLGKRSQRFMMIVDNGVVRDLQVEEKGSDVLLSSAETCALKLAN